QVGGVLDVEAGVEGADADPLLVAGGKAPSVAGRHVAPVDPDLEVLRAAVGMNLQTPGEGRVGRLIAPVGGQDPPPAERVDDQGGGDVATVGLHGRTAAPAHLRRLELGVALLPEQRAELAIIERREGPGELVARGAMWRVNHQLAELLPG